MKEINIKCSRQSVKRFIRLFLSLNATPYWFHQTLTFRNKIEDVDIAKSYLKKLLDSLGQVFPELCVIFVQEYQERIGIHYHLILILFGEHPLSPDKMREELGQQIFKRWNKLNGNSLVRHANKITRQKQDIRTIEYLTEGLLLTREKLNREILWHGVRNRKLLGANSSPVPNNHVNEVFYQLFPKMPKPAPPQEPLPKYFSKQDLERLKKDVEVWSRVRGKEDWDGFKSREVGVGKKVSDREFMEFRNREWNKRVYGDKPLDMGF